MNAILGIASAALLAAPEAQACSMKEGYRTPTNFELLEKAELVVLGRLQNGAPKPVDQHGMVTMALEPIRVLKGQLPDQTLSVTSMKDWNGALIPTLPTSLDQSHFSAGLGACVRIFYPPGGLILAMFEKGPEGWSQSWAAFARTAEDVEAEDGIWVRAAEAYVALQARTRLGQRRQAIQMFISELDAGAPDSLKQAMAADLRRHLAVTVGETKVERPVWSMLNAPSQAGAVIVLPAQSGPSRRSTGAITCLAGSDSLAVIVHRRDAALPMSLVIGDQRFEAEEEEVKTSFGERYVQGNVPLSDRLLAALSAPAARAGLRIGDSGADAPPAEVLSLLARQCHILRTQPPAPEGDTDPSE